MISHDNGNGSVLRVPLHCLKSLCLAGNSHLDFRIPDYSVEGDSEHTLNIYRLMQFKYRGLRPWPERSINEFDFHLSPSTCLFPWPSRAIVCRSA